MSRPKAMASLVCRIARLGIGRVQTQNFGYSTMVQSQMSNQSTARAMDRYKNEPMSQNSGGDSGDVCKHQLGQNLSRKDKNKFLVSTLNDLNDSKEAVYSALDAWVAWEENFPVASLRRVLLDLEKEQQWHRIVQVIKWMLSKGQGTTMGTYGQLIKALDMDHRAEEAHKFWQRKIGLDLHSVPWQLCKRMISIYYRNNMLGSLIELFKGLEAFGRKPPDKSVLQQVANAYEMLGLLEEKERVLGNYNDLFTETGKRRPKKSKGSSKKKEKSVQHAS